MTDDITARLAPWLEFLRYAMAGQDVRGSLIYGLGAVVVGSLVVMIVAKASGR